MAECNCRLEAYVGWVECSQIPTNRSLTSVIHLPRSLENRRQDRWTEDKARPTSFSKGLGRGILGDPRRLLTRLPHRLESGLVPIFFTVRTFGLWGEADTDSGGCDNDTLHKRTFGIGRLNDKLVGVNEGNIPVFYSSLEYIFRAIYGRNNDIWHRGEWEVVNQLRMVATIWVIRVEVEWGSGVSDGIDPTQNVVERARLPHSNRCPEECVQKEQSTTHRSDILHDGKLEFITMFREEFLEVLPFVERPNDTPDNVPFLQKDIDDVNGEEPICASDEDLVSWGNSRHGLYNPRVVPRMWKVVEV